MVTDNARAEADAALTRSHAAHPMQRSRKRINTSGPSLPLNIMSACKPLSREDRFRGWIDNASVVTNRRSQKIRAHQRLDCRGARARRSLSRPCLANGNLEARIGIGVAGHPCLDALSIGDAGVLA